ncbi:MAG: SigE family RNA polymerase sigma factor [Actinomycetota bacterium]
MTRHPAPLPGDTLDERIDDLFRRRYLAMVRVAHLLVGNLAGAEDIVQEAFARIYPRLPGLGPGDQADAYLTTVVINLARRTLRRAAMARAYGRLVGPGGEAGEDPVDRQAVLGALRQLSPRQRSCVVLRYFLAYTEAEIASELKISAGSVKTHTARGLAALAKLLGDEGDEP